MPSESDLIFRLTFGFKAWHGSFVDELQIWKTRCLNGLMYKYVNLLYGKRLEAESLGAIAMP